MFNITDWDNAYANAANIPGGDRWPEAWVGPAQQFRDECLANLDQSYGPHPREKFDLFLPAGKPKGLVVFVHGGFWVRLEKSYWSHLAAGPVARGWAVAVPSYTLCPDTNVTGIVAQIAKAVTKAAAEISGPIRLTGHSAGGQIVTRLMCADSGLPENVLQRIAHVVSISGVHDLRPLLRTKLNDDIRLTEAEAQAQSPALLIPRTDIPLTCWVGQSERSEFVRQNALLANIWTGLGARTQVVAEPDKHHFDVIDGLSDAHSPLCRALLETV
jgi:arylformamidase